MNNGMKIEKIELNKKNVKALLQSQDVMNHLRNIAISRGNIVTEFVGVDRCHVHYRER